MYESPAALGTGCDIVGLCVTGDEDVRDVVLRDGDGLLSGMRAGSVIAIHSTISPATAADVAHAATRTGVHVLDAPVSGGPGGARAGTMTVMVGGDADVLAMARPVFESFASTIVHLGPIGSGQLMKLLNNNLCYATVAMSISTLAIAAQLGIDPDVAAAVMATSSGASMGLRIVSDEMLLSKAVGPTSNMAKDVALFHAILADHGLAGEPMAKAAASAPGRVIEFAKQRGTG